MHDKNQRTRRNTLASLGSITLGALAGCTSLGFGQNTTSDAFTKVAIEGTDLVIELPEETSIDHVNVVQPDGGLFAENEIATGVQRVTIEIGTSYDPGEYQVIGLDNEDVIDQRTLTIEPKLEILDVGLYRNNPDKPWDEVYGGKEAERTKNAEVFVEVENTGTGPEVITELRLSGDIPNSAENYEGNGIYGEKLAIVESGAVSNIFSDLLPFAIDDGSGMGCRVDGANGEFVVALESGVTGDQITKKFEVSYSGSDSMSDCNISISPI
ncbi:hypothetical protein ACFQH6_04655 [Halobacteriaceae archaeon GCM10025711]